MGNEKPTTPLHLQESLPSGERLDSDVAAQFSDAALDLEPQEILRQQLLGRLIVGQTIGVSLLSVMTLAGGLLAGDSGLMSVVPLGVIGLVVGLVAYWLFRRQQGVLAAYVFLLGTVAAITALIYIRGYQDASPLYYLWPILAGALLLETRGTIAITGACAAVYVILVLLQEGGYQVVPVPYDPQEEALLTTGSRLIMFFLLAFLGWLFRRNLGRAVVQANEAVRRWRGLSSTLERRVAERTSELERRARYLEVTATIARDTAEVMEVDQLLVQIVELISEQFGFYHTGVFLLDEAGEWAVLKAASSPGGQRMLSRGHRLRIGQEGIVGYAVGRGRPHVALDVGEDAVHFDNPDLPETRSEMALPLRFRGKVLGALDVQSRETAAFSDQDVVVMQTLADQVAVAIQNARLFQEAQESLAAERRAYGELSREAWATLLRARPHLGFTRSRDGLSPAGKEWRPEMEKAVQAGQTTVEEDGGRGTATVAIPVRVGGQIIGVVDARRRLEAGEWSPQEIELVETLSEQLGLALEGARLYQDTQRRAARDRLLGEVTARMRESLEMETLLRTAASEMRQALGLDDLVVRLTAPGGDGDPAQDLTGTQVEEGTDDANLD
jgi:GAF domain-containing protein